MPLICSVFQATLRRVLDDGFEERLNEDVCHISREISNQEHKSYANELNLLTNLLIYVERKDISVETKGNCLKCMLQLCKLRSGRKELSGIYEQFVELISECQEEELIIKLINILELISTFPDFLQFFNEHMGHTSHLLLSLINPEKLDLSASIFPFLENTSLHFQLYTELHCNNIINILKKGPNCMPSKNLQALLQALWNLCTNKKIREKMISLQCLSVFPDFLSFDDANIIRLSSGVISGLTVSESAKLICIKEEKIIENLCKVYLELPEKNDWLVDLKTSIKRNVKNALRFITENKKSLPLVGKYLKTNPESLIDVLGPYNSVECIDLIEQNYEDENTISTLLKLSETKEGCEAIWHFLNVQQNLIQLIHKKQEIMIIIQNLSKQIPQAQQFCEKSIENTTNGDKIREL